MGISSEDNIFNDDIQILFDHKPVWDEWEFWPDDMVLDEKSEDHKSYYKFNGNSHNSLWRHLIKKCNCQPHGGAWGKVRESAKSVEFTPWGAQMHKI